MTASNRPTEIDLCLQEFFSTTKLAGLDHIDEGHRSHASAVNNNASPIQESSYQNCPNARSDACGCIKLAPLKYILP